VRSSRVWKQLLGVEHTVVERVEFEGEGAEAVLVAQVRPTRGQRGRCSRCGRRCRGYDAGRGQRRWRTLDLGSTRAFLEADASRVSCPVDGVVVAAVPWARPEARFTRSFEDQCAWLAAHTPASTVAELLRLSWRTVTAIVTRVVADARGSRDMLAGLGCIGIDELAHRKGQRYVTVVIDHDTGRLVWAAEGRDEATVETFFDALGEARAAELTHVSADGAQWIHNPVTRLAPQAVICLDAFHVVAWATKALDAVRRGMWNDLRRSGNAAAAAELKGTRWALLKDPHRLTPTQRGGLTRVQRTNAPLYRAWLLKEQLRLVFAEKGDEGRALLAGWLWWAKRSKIPEFEKLATTIERYRPLICNTLDHGLSNARSEATNTHLRVLTRRSYGFHTPDALIAMAMLTRGGLCPALPGRAP
jgi:transposase